MDSRSMDNGKKMIRVLLVSPLPPPAGGICTWTETLLKEKGKYPSVKIKHVDVMQRWIKRENRSRVLRLIGGSLQALRDIVRIMMALALFQPHVLHLTSSAGNASLKDMLLMLLARGFGVHGLLHYRTSRIANSQVTQGWQLQTALFAMQFASVVVVLDQETYVFLQQKENLAQKLKKIPNMIDMDKINRLISPQDLVSLDRPKKDQARLVFVGLVALEKGIVEQVEACTQLEGVQLHVVGPVKDKFRHQLEELARCRDGGQWLHFHGHVDNEEACRQILLSDILMLPSRKVYEAFPNALMEGMALAKPVVVSDVGAMAEMIDADGVNPCGVCVKPGDTASLREGLNTLLTHPEHWETMGQRGRKRVEALYATGPVMQQLVDQWLEMALHPESQG